MSGGPRVRRIPHSQEAAFANILSEPVRNGVYRSKEFHGRGAKMVNMGELFAHPRLADVPMKRVELDEAEKNRFSVRRGDLLFARRSLVAEGAGKCCVVLEAPEPTAFESSIIRARPDPAKAHSLFLYYYFNSPEGRQGLDSIRRQVAVAGITGNDLANLKLLVPPLPEQRTIARILGTLDDKIELNRRMNETLETMARALFKSWFVDFEPVRAKTEGRDLVLPQGIAAVFPTEIARMGAQDAPVGWRAYSLNDLAVHHTSTVSPRTTPDVLFEHYSMPAYDALQTPTLESGVAIKSNKTLVPRNAVLLSKLNPQIPRVWAPSDPQGATQICSTEFLAFAPLAPGSRSLLYSLLSDDKFRTMLRSLVTGTSTSHQRVPPKSLKAHLAITGEPNAFRAFDSLAKPWLNQAIANRAESQLLARVRDLLLPKLISGEVRTAQAERAVEAVTGAANA